MHYAIDDLVLTPVNDTGIDTSSRRSKGVFAQSQNIAGTRQVRRAQPLKTWTLTVSSFALDGMEVADTLRTMQEKGEPHTVSDYDGNDLGQWTIDDVNEKGSELSDNGVHGQVGIDLTLLEWRQDEATSVSW